MSLPYVIDEAKGADIEVADPDFVTTAESRVMPPSPKSAAAMALAADEGEQSDSKEDSAAGAGGPPKRPAADAFTPEPRTRTKARTGASPTRPSPTTVSGVESF